MYKIGRFIGLPSIKLAIRTLASIKLRFIYSFILEPSIKLERFCGALNLIFTTPTKFPLHLTLFFLGVPHLD